MQHIFWKCRKIAPATQDDFWRVLKHVGMPRSATPATKRHDHIFWHVKKVTFLRLFLYRHGNFEATTAADGRLRTVADGCGRLRTVANACGRQTSTVTRTRVNPQTPKCKTRTLRYAFGRKQLHIILAIVWLGNLIRSKCFDLSIWEYESPKLLPEVGCGQKPCDWPL